ncbi:hypothetical protein MKW98_029269 [Papaver atlanticum]|uniref:C3H1-type domain-containing protein n=1 Tax=Papaver atlanticum TaxID=357466 RepID=A0AAD4SHU1_9MAGN|nr:hypothetical protein MKW98_029269 [Papaver atlanticum]
MMVHVPPWSLYDQDSVSGNNNNMMYQLPVSGVGSGCNNNINNGGGDYSPLCMSEAISALSRYLPSNDLDSDDSDLSSVVDAYSCDEFRMYEFKVRRCSRGRSHDWTECPYAHPGEKARRRDPRKFHYSGTACPDFRKGNCKRGDTCEYAHGVFECWLHPARYRTQPCKDGTSCRRRVCFFAHTPEQLRILPSQSQLSPRTESSPPSYDGSPLRVALDSYYVGSSPTSTLNLSPPMSPNSGSPPMSPSTGMGRSTIGSNSVNEMVLNLRNLQLNKVKSAPSSWVMGSSSFLSPRASSSLRPGFSSLPTTPTRTPTTTRSGGGVGGYLDFWDQCGSLEEEPAMERVESGRNLRSKIYEKLSKENSFGRERVDSVPGSSGPDVQWVSELVK